MSWFKTDRNIFETEVFDNQEFSEREAWLWLISSACFEDCVINILNNPTKLKRGQLSFSLRFLAERFKWSKNHVNRFFDKLKKWDMVVIENGTGQNIITICNYSLYQGEDESIGTEAGQQAGQKRDRSGTKNKNLRTKEDKNIDSIGEKTEILHFDEFFSIFPKQRAGSKEKAKLAYLKVIKENRATEEEILEGVKKYGISDEVSRGFAKNCAGWLNDDRYKNNYRSSAENNKHNNKNPSYMDKIQNAGEIALRKLKEDELRMGAEDFGLL